MQLCATFGLDDLTDLAREVTPLEVEVGRRPRRSVALGEPTKIELVPGAGLRMRGDARFNWAGFPVTLRAWQVLVRPSIVGHRLAVDLELEHLDFKGIPAFLVDTIRTAINDGLASQKQKLAVSLDRVLSFSSMLPARVTPPRELTVCPTDASIEVTASALILTVRFAAGFRQPLVAALSA